MLLLDILGSLDQKEPQECHEMHIPWSLGPPITCLCVCVLSVCACVGCDFPGVGNVQVISTLNGVLTLLFILVAHRGEPPLLGRLPSLIRTSRERSFPFIDFSLLAYLITLLFIYLMSLLFKLTDHYPNIQIIEQWPYLRPFSLFSCGYVGGRL